MNHARLDGKQRRAVSRPVQLGELLGRMELLQGGWGIAQGEKKEVWAHKWEMLVFVCSGLTAGHIACNCSQGWRFQLLYVFVLLEGRWNSECLVRIQPTLPKASYYSTTDRSAEEQLYLLLQKGSKEMYQQANRNNPGDSLRISDNSKAVNFRPLKVQTLPFSQQLGVHQHFSGFLQRRLSLNLLSGGTAWGDSVGAG